MLRQLVETSRAATEEDFPSCCGCFAGDAEAWVASPANRWQRDGFLSARQVQYGGTRDILWRSQCTRTMFRS